MASARSCNAAAPGAEISLGHTTPEVRTVNGLADGTLLDRWREHRDGDAFAELARRHSPVVFDLTVRVLGDRSGAEDVLQEALLSLALERTRKPAEVGVVAWLARFAICRARNRRASERSRARRQWIVGSERPEAEMPDDAMERRDEMERALAGCDPESRALLAMRFLYGWDYDRIGAALSITSGAARVRVHRAISAVRARTNVGRTAKVAPALAGIPLAALPAARLDTVVREAVAIATVRLGAPPNGIEQATAASHSFQAAVALTGAALLFVGIAGVAASPPSAGRTPGDATDVASLGAAGGQSPWAVVPAASYGASGDAPFIGAPRAPHWDRGALRGSAVDPADEEPPAAAGPGEAPGVAETAAEPGAPAAAATDVPHGPATVAGEEPPSASRPTVRATCAAKGEPASSDDERAGALGGSSTAMGEVQEERAETPPPEEATPPAVVGATVVGSPVAGPASSSGSSVRRPTRASFDELPEETQELLGEAEALVRRMLSGDDETAGVTTGSLRSGVRAVRRRFDVLRRESAADASPDASPERVGKAARARQAAAVRQVLTLLTQVALSDDRTAGDLRWPRGADLDAALAEVVRILGEAADATRDLPSGAGSELPSGAEEQAE